MKQKTEQEIPYPEKPYTATHEALYPSGFKRLLVPWGRKCHACPSTHTFLDGGVPACQKHLSRVCKHGAVACANCWKVPQGKVAVKKLRTPRAA